MLSSPNVGRTVLCPSICRCASAVLTRNLARNGFSFSVSGWRGGADKSSGRDIGALVLETYLLVVEIIIRIFRTLQIENHYTNWKWNMKLKLGVFCVCTFHRADVCVCVRVCACVYVCLLKVKSRRILSLLHNCILNNSVFYTRVNTWHFPLFGSMTKYDDWRCVGRHVMIDGVKKWSNG